jgi:hypothetical protein
MTLIWTASEMDLNEMVYAEGASCTYEKICLPGTRQTIIDEIMDWANLPADDASPRLLWLTGVAGSGKSAIAHSIAHRFRALKRLGSSFCFDAANQASRSPHHLFSTISRDLAGFDPLWKKALWDIIKDDLSMRKTYSEQYQFENFLVQPAQSLAMVGPVVIVIDALDECGDLASRKKLLSILDNQLSQLPGNFRIIVTSRPESDISEALQNKPHIICKHMGSIDISHNRHDITLFIHQKLSGRIESSLTKYQSNWCEVLVDKSEGLFQWAFTACKFIDEQSHRGHQIHKLFQLLLESSGGTSQLDYLYSNILDQNLSGHDQNVIHRFQAVMEVVLTMKKPLSRSALSFLCHGEDHDSVVSILEPLGALLDGVTSDSVPIHTLHTSFRDFLMNKELSGKYYVDTVNGPQNLTWACLNVMNGLHFNICQLPSSYQKNKDVPDLEARIQRNIPDHLAYACHYWADHLEDTTYTDTIKLGLAEMMKSKLLYWLEVLSVTDTVHLATGSLNKLALWINVSISLLIINRPNGGH